MNQIELKALAKINLGLEDARMDTMMSEWSCSLFICMMK